MRTRITVQIGPEDKQKIEQIIKERYPKIKNVSDVVRAALVLLFNEEGCI